MTGSSCADLRLAATRRLPTAALVSRAPTRWWVYVCLWADGGVGAWGSTTLAPPPLSTQRCMYNLPAACYSCPDPRLAVAGSREGAKTCPGLWNPNTGCMHIQCTVGEGLGFHCLRLLASCNEGFQTQAI